MGHYRKKPVEIEAWQVGTVDMPPWLQAAIQASEVKFFKGDHNNVAAEVHTLEGVMACSFGDWIIRGVKGELYPCRDDIFRQTYEEVPQTKNTLSLEDAIRLQTKGMSWDD